MENSKVKGQKSKVTFAVAALLVAVVLVLSGCGPSATVNSQSNATPVAQPNTAPTPGGAVENPAPVTELPTVPPVAQPGTVVEPVKGKDGNTEGNIDWGVGIIHATGKSAIDNTITNKGQAQLMAERGAVVDAQRNLLEITEGVRVNGETMVEDYITKSDIIFSRVDGLVKGARQVGEAKYDSSMGIVTVELVMDLYGKKGVSDAILPDQTAAPATQPPLSQETVRLMSKYSSIVIQGAGTNAQPGLFPKLYDEKGNLLLDTRELAAQNGSFGAGAIQFIDNISSVLNNPELGKNPLVIQVKSVMGKYLTDYMVPADQATLLSGLKTAWPYILKAGRFLFNLLVP
jgi:hypothetical protein